ncbi:MAG: DUF4416 family protein [Myxococcales bacterium]|nr:MAG: DUF4416 family protein [Myxococcales bacterium]
MPPTPAEPVKLFVGLLFAPDAGREALLAALAERFGPIDYRSPVYPFTATDYYAPEMGAPIERRFASFEPLIDPAALAGIKRETAAIEARFARRDGTRSVNVDPGYMDTFKIVLASFKPGWQKIYLGEGVWADPTLYYRKGRFLPFEWGFPDFRSGLYDPALGEIRARYKAQRKIGPA